MAKPSKTWSTTLMRLLSLLSSMKNKRKSKISRIINKSKKPLKTDWMYLKMLLISISMKHCLWSITSMLQLCILILLLLIDYSLWLLLMIRFAQGVYLIVLNIIVKGHLNGNGKESIFHSMRESIFLKNRNIFSIMNMRSKLRLKRIWRPKWGSIVNKSTRKPIYQLVKSEEIQFVWGKIHFM